MVRLPPSLFELAVDLFPARPAVDVHQDALPLVHRRPLHECDQLHRAPLARPVHQRLGGAPPFLQPFIARQAQRA
jgi:hypothetical protein